MIAGRGRYRLAPLALAGVLAALAAAFAGPAAAAPQASLPDVEDEVMCPICGTLLELSEAPQAERERAFVRRLIAAGQTKDEIKDALVAEYGEGVLATPSGSGFDLSAYLVPIAAFLVAALALGIGVGRWRRNSGRGGGDGGTLASGPSGEDAQRLEADLSRYDL